MLTDAKIAGLRAPATGQEEHADSRVIGLRLRVGNGGAKTWILRKRIGKTVINRKLGSYPSMSLATARKAAEALLDTLERENTVEAIDRTFGQVAEAWIDKVAKLKNASWKEQERRLEMHVLPHWRDRRIAEIRRADVRALLDGIEGVVLPNRILATIRPVFRFALARDWIEFSPADGIAKPKAEEARDRVLTMPELARIWNGAALCGWPFGHMVRLLMLTGQRRSEVAGMKWGDLDLEAGTWSIAAADTKAGRAHLVPLSGPVLAILRASPRFGAFVLSGDGETHVKGYSKGKQALDKFLEATGEPLPTWRLHDLRRSCATHMVRLGISEAIVGRVLNHAAQGVTARVYALHSYAPEKRHALEAWGAELLRTIEGTGADNVVQINGAR